MTIEGFKKAFNKDTFFLFKTTGNTDHFKVRMKTELEIDDATQTVSYTDINGYKFTIDINDIALVSCCLV